MVCIVVDGVLVYLFAILTFGGDQAGLVGERIQRAGDLVNELTGGYMGGRARGRRRTSERDWVEHECFLRRAY